ncbi:hypothetical protein [Methylophilus rhizosphaerae]|nr:hypothetical protein [Methylophilus rhizosphaerae]
MINTNNAINVMIVNAFFNNAKVEFFTNKNKNPEFGLLAEYENNTIVAKKLNTATPPDTNKIADDVPNI